MVIDTPAEISRTGSGPETPPGIVTGLLVKYAEGIDITIVEEPAHPFPFFRKEAAAVGIPDGVMNVDGLMADVEIPA